MRASYRLQLRGGTDLDAARRLAPHLSRLGVSHLYLSPIFCARSGSAHGYDVTDPLRVDPTLGGEAALARLAAALRRHGLGLLLDVVPNHQAADPANPYFADVLRHGRGSRFARWFDVRWGEAARIVLPVLGADARTLAARGEIALMRARGEPLLAVHGRRFPLAPESRAAAEALLRARRPARAALLRLLERQPYRLLPWRSGKRALNYRRFFDIDELIAVRCEDPAVFDETHAALLDWVTRGWVDAVRVDHVDGLADPAGYLVRLRAALDARRPARRVPVYVEKILAHDEHLPRGWPVAGTTGYEFAAALDAACVSPRGAAKLRAFWRARTGQAASFGAVARASKREVLEALFPAELGELERLLAEAFAETHVRPPRALRAALVESIAALDVYRSYPDRRGRLGARDRARWVSALERARHGKPGLGRALDALGQLLDAPAASPARARFVVRLQQLCGPAAAKGVEDTALYRHFAVPSLCEVGGDPEAPRGDARAALHRANLARLREHPDALLAATTHDTKRSADVRARLAALTTNDAAWRSALPRFPAAPAPRPAPDETDALGLYLALVALWPNLAPGALPTTGQLRTLRERLVASSRKAAREARRRTSWLAPNAAYEQALERFVAGLLADRRFLREFAALALPLVHAGAEGALARRLVQLTAPGVPDLYQGEELGLLALVDPDNRRPPDFARARRRLGVQLRRLRLPAEARAAALARLARTPGDERLALWVTHAALEARRQAAPLFARGDYLPLRLSGPGAAGWLAFARCRGDRVALVAARLRTETPATDAPRLALPPALAGARLRCALGGRRLSLGAGELPLAPLLGGLPVALLVGRARATTRRALRLPRRSATSAPPRSRRGSSRRRGPRPATRRSSARGRRSRSRSPRCGP